MGLKRIGIFGGSFDPLHCGHISIAKLARKQFNLYTVYIVPVLDQWLKGHDLFAGAEDRLDMARAAVTDIEGIEVSDIDIRIGTPTYTINTIINMRKNYKHIGEIYVIFGDDTMETIGNWYRSEDLSKLANIVFYKRKNRNAILDTNLYPFTSPPVFIDGPYIDLSSTKIRNLLSLDLSVSGLVHPKVEEIILKRNLYGRIRT
ncbi:MAG: nicotinate (nicotinamide) nucleotide adenylyltransferase [Dehalococcoidia bacterium]|jgi:nicotinate-nucleotide adenylyltransferase|nr:nicotinate (nicotinamide) nucleotide adenylyltransferase [Dehalococcoidia bacterium]MDP7231282.1 nicotinate (nicotinamide) nucleotide adenylyltransferase [Dehalococcoidia bacterium]|tara:strand:+ start:471 stop:1079 length:609 start_codon:yes stop_codon:yes gene_type:complete